ncbi:hypothetical protein Tco_0955215 [Tanacetum coccineum]|uniref:Retrovirus-related Pol polyprotein from transposon TNT 1-94-like beta-barrel domain-containing protein n=1 Tax=Tanacetum coccineum TaxID=301880 RepID=A0ABQ5E6J3_9ASTR
MSLKIITKNKRLKATRDSLEKEISILKENLSTLEKNKEVDLECVKCHMLKIENEKLKEEALKLTKFEKSTHCLNEMLNNQKPSGEKLGLGFNSFEASSSGTKEIKFVKAQKKASSDGGPINMGGPLNVQAAPKANMGPPPGTTPGSEKSICLGVDLEPDEWIKDSGCSKHMTGNRKLFSSYKAYNGGNVIFGSNLRGNIIGKGQICDNKCRVTFSEHDSEITKDGKVIGRGIRKKGLYVMKLGNKPKDVPAQPEANHNPESSRKQLEIAPENRAHFESEKEAIHLILTGIGDEIYLTLISMATTQENVKGIERLQQGESLNIQLDVDENKKIQKQLKKANATLTQELTECKSILAETSRTLGESNSIGIAHKTNVSRPQPRSNQMKDKVVPNTSHVKFKKTEVEEHPRISSISNQTKSVTTCNDSLNSRTSNVNAVCATCGKYVFNVNHDACVSKFLKDVNARTKKPNGVPISTRKPKSQANKFVATPHKKTVASESTITNSKSYYRMLYKKTSKAWKWWIAQQCPSA